MPSIDNEMKRMIKRFWNNLENGLNVLLKDETISINTTVKELQDIIKQKKNEPIE